MSLSLQRNLFMENNTVLFCYIETYKKYCYYLIINSVNNREWGGFGDI